MGGISQAKWHKKRKTGGKRPTYKKKRKYELGRPASMTKIGGYRVHLVRVRGGNIKRRALRLDTGNFSWGSEAIARKARIIDTVYQDARQERYHFHRRGAVPSMVRGPLRHAARQKEGRQTHRSRRSALQQEEVQEDAEEVRRQEKDRQG